MDQSIQISCSDAERRHLDALVRHLRPFMQRRSFLRLVCPMESEAISESPSAVCVAVFLVSSHFLSSDPIQGQVSALLAAGVTPLCLYLEACNAEECVHAW